MMSLRKEIKVKLDERKKRKTTEIEEKINFIKRHKLNEGSYGVVYIVNKSVVMKEQKKEKDNSHVIREIAMMNMFNVDLTPQVVSIDLANKSYCMNRYVCSLYDMLNKGIFFENKGIFFEEEYIKKNMWRMVSTLKLFDNYNIIHRDIKIDNILIDDSGNFVLADWGLSCLVVDGISDKYEYLTEINIIRAPEIIYNEEFTSSIKQDIWSLGMIFYSLIYCDTSIYQSKYNRDTYKKTYYNICDNLISMPNDSSELILNMITLDEKKRYCYDKIINDKYFSKMNFKYIIKKRVIKKIGIDKSKLLMNIDMILDIVYNSHLIIKLSMDNLHRYIIKKEKTNLVIDFMIIINLVIKLCVGEHFENRTCLSPYNLATIYNCITGKDRNIKQVIKYITNNEDMILGELDYKLIDVKRINGLKDEKIDKEKYIKILDEYFI